MIKVYMHYGIEVKRQIIDTCFTSVLAQNNVSFIELPLLNNRILKYTKDSENIYALIVPLNSPDEYAEAVYLTKAVPDDGDWEKLRSDVESQNNGAKPEKMESRLKLLLDRAYDIAHETLSEKYPSDNWMVPAEIPEAELIKGIVLELARMGVDVKNLAGAWDVDQDWINKIKNAF